MKTIHFTYKCRRCGIFVHKPFEQKETAGVLPHALLSYAVEGSTFPELPSTTAVHSCRGFEWGVCDLVGCSEIAPR